MFLRLNLEQGRFLSPYETESPSNNVCTVNPEHQLLMVGGSDGAVEAWDPRQGVNFRKEIYFSCENDVCH